MTALGKAALVFCFCTGPVHACIVGRSISDRSHTLGRQTSLLVVLPGFHLCRCRSVDFIGAVEFLFGLTGHAGIESACNLLVGQQVHVLRASRPNLLEERELPLPCLRQPEERLLRKGSSQPPVLGCFSSMPILHYIRRRQFVFRCHAGCCGLWQFPDHALMRASSSWFLVHIVGLRAVIGHSSNALRKGQLCGCGASLAFPYSTHKCAKGPRRKLKGLATVRSDLRHYLKSQSLRYRRLIGEMNAG